MQKPGRDTRVKQDVITKAQSMAKAIGCAFFVTFIKTVNSTLRSKGAMFAFVSLFIPLSVLLTVLNTNIQPTQAATSDTLNFQGRLLTNTGALVPDGTYNVEFNLYNVSTAGSTLWTEDRLNTNTQGVTVKNGYFSVYLGEYDAFGSIDWDQNMYLGMTIRGTGSCAWGSCTPADAEMTPRFKLSSVPYAYSAKHLTTTSGAFRSTLGFTTPTANRTITLPDDDGTVCLTSGNCAGVGGTGDIINGGQAGALTIGTTNATTLSLLQNGTAALTINASQLLQFNAYDCTSFTNGGALTADASGNITCTNDDGGGGGTGVDTVGALDGGTPNANGASITGTTIYLQSASATNAGLVNTTTQTFAGDKTFNGSLVVAASQSLTLTGGNTASRPGSPTEGMVYYDTTTKKLLTYANGKWQQDRTDAILVAAANSTQADKDAADYVADGEIGDKQP